MSTPADKSSSTEPHVTFQDNRTTAWRVGKLQYFCLHLAYAMLLLVSIVLVISSVARLLAGNFVEGLLTFIAAPAVYGVSVAVGLVIEQVERNKDESE